MGIITTYPLWFLVFCIALGVGYAMFLYYREKRNEFSRPLKIILGLLRFLAVSIISFLLLGPFIRSFSRSSEEPILIMAIDNSSSVLLNEDSLNIQNELPGQLDLMASGLGEKYDVRSYTFGEQLNALPETSNLKDVVSYTEKESNIAELFKELESIYANRNVGALLMVSDGIFNQGMNPVYASQRARYPVYTLGVGNPDIQKDLILARVNYNRLAYLGNEFPVSVVINAFRYEGESTEVSIYRNGTFLAKEQVKFDNNRASVEISFQLQADKVGLARYQIRLKSLGDEVTLQNNERDIFIEILDGRNNILLLYNAPHPDVSALKEAIRSNLNYEVDEVYIEDFDGNIEKYNLVVLHQLPSKTHPIIDIRDAMIEKQIPYLMIIGEGTDLQRFNAWRTGLEITMKRDQFEEVMPDLNSGFTLFNLSDESRRVLGDWTPLHAAFGDYRMQNSAIALMNQRIGTVRTKKPLILFNVDGGNRNGVIAGTGIWRWRLTDYLINEHHYSFNEVINKMVQFLAVKENKSRFRVYHMNSFAENEPILFDAEFYNQSYELTNEAEALLTITNEEGNKFPYIFNPKMGSYSLDAGTLDVGNYSYQAELKYGGENFLRNGSFSVRELDLENLNTVADFNMLKTLAQQHDGEFFILNELNELEKSLQERDDIKAVVYSQKNITELINIPWILILIVALMSLEWFLRKRAGAY